MVTRPKAETHCAQCQRSPTQDTRGGGGAAIEHQFNLQRSVLRFRFSGRFLDLVSLSSSPSKLFTVRREKERGRKGALDMWVFYLISLPLTLGMVVLTLKYFAGPDVPRYVFFTVGYTWFCSLSIIIIVPADIWTVISYFHLNVSKCESDGT